MCKNGSRPLPRVMASGLGQYCRAAIDKELAKDDVDGEAPSSHVD